MSFDNRDYNRDTTDHDYYSRAPGWSVTIWLIVINIVCFFIDGFSARAMGRQVMFEGGFLSDIGSFSAQKSIFEFQVWRFLTFQFLHAGIGHILFNMLILFYLGRRLESFLGPRRYLAFYLISGAGGALMYLVLWGIGALTGNPNIPFLLINDAQTPLVGASAGIFGVLVACAVVMPHERIHLIFPPVSITIQAIALVLLLLALFMVMIGGPNAGGEAAHLGGAALGFLLIRHKRLLAFSDRPGGGFLHHWREGRKRKRQERRNARLASDEAEVDRILAKVKDHGLHSLTEREKKTLQRATEDKRRAG